MHRKPTSTSLLHPFVITLLFLVVLPGVASATDDPIYVGVLLPLSGPEGQNLYDALQLARDQINAGGGIGGRPLELILRDTRTGDIRTYAEYLVKDPRIRVVIGPYSSDDLFLISDQFTRNHKVLISPTASSDEIYRAYAGTGSVWRTIANDGDITSAVMHHIAAHNGKRVALLTINSTYGTTFYDWIPYWAIENGITITGIEEYSVANEIPDAIDRLITQNPDYLIFVHSGLPVEIGYASLSLNAMNTTTHLYLIYPDVDAEGQIWERVDPGTLEFLLTTGLWKTGTVSTLSAKLPDNTLMLMSKPWDAEFSQEFKRVSNTTRADFVPEVYDALLAATAIMARFTAYPDKSPEHAARTILTNGTGDPLERSEDGFQLAFDQILDGNIPVMTGVTGPLTFLPEGVDRAIPWYETYRIEEGNVIPDPVLIQTRMKSDSILNQSDTRSVFPVPTDQVLSSGDYWAVIGAFTRDWVNYRHQADALTMYTYLKEKGVPDDHIILLVFDDIPLDRQNPKPGEVYHTPGEEEVRRQANPDYIGENVNKQMLMDILTGTGIENNEPLLRSNENSTVLVYISSHGAPGGDLLFGDGSEQVSPEEISAVFDSMANKKKFGRMLLILESCFSGVTAAQLTTPGVLVLTASAEDETSKSATYDSELSCWLSDEFTKELVSLLRSPNPPNTIRQLYQQLYYNVRSSHPSITRGNESLDIPVHLFFGGDNDETT